MEDDLNATGPEESRPHDSPSASRPRPGVARQIEALQAQVRTDGFRRMSDEQTFLDDLSGDI
ncbi:MULTISPECIES: hypothetical protein [unclassified Paracoccus (in: a-proteobacteria)]|uniref:hypothetical protein n=1 Tax=unclassified Paracoccus (in: a-proteobacteria) TaxID=2688777 RepID=UPI000225F867|nr:MULTISPECIES: hypothetical protein [unclassified Paracoccus (in: a-proteobacteria)]